MAIVFMTDPSTGRCCLYDENGTTGDANNPNATRNAPLNSPASHLDKIYFHSDFDYLEVHATTTKTISHASVAAGSLPVTQSVKFGWNAASADHLLLAHSLGYAPFALVAVGDNIIWPGMAVQTAADGGARYASVYCTTTGVYLYEWASIGASTLAATSLDYDVIIFRDPPAASGSVLVDFDPSTGVVTMGKGKFNSSRNYLQVVSGGTPFGLSLGRTIDLNNGAPRAVRPDGTTFDPVPSTLKLGIYGGPVQSAPASFGSAMNYGGSYTGPTAIEVQAP